MAKNIKKDNSNKYLKIIIMILVIIIILLLLHNCSLRKKSEHGDNINICEKCECDKKPCKKDVINCLVNRSIDNRCIVPDFNKKKVEDVNSWLNGISNNLSIKYEYKESNEEPGTIIGQSVQAGTSVESVLDDNLQIIIYISIPKKVAGSVDNIPNNTSNNNSNTNQDNIPEQKPDNPFEPLPEEFEKELIVFDKDLHWNSETSANIFENSMYDLRIAPEVSNTYRFTVFNNTGSKVQYKVTFDETNTSNINMKYKLRKNNTYLYDNYVSINDIIINEALIEDGKTDTFYLEWKWISSENDTEIGASGNAEYSLKINVESEGVNE